MVVFRGDLEVEGKYDLYSVPLTGGPRIRLTKNVNWISSFQITPDGENVLYTASMASNSPSELWIIPIHGGEPLKLNHDLHEGESVFSCYISPDNNYVAYKTEYGVTPSYGDYDLYIVPTTRGSGPVHLIGNPGEEMQAGSSVVFSGEPLNRVIFDIHTDAGGGSRILYSDDVLGSSRIALNSPPVGNVKGVDTFRIAPNGMQVVYSAELEAGFPKIYSSTVLGEDAKIIAEILDNLSDPIISYDSKTVVFHNTKDIYSVPVDGIERQRNLSVDITGSGGWTQSSMITPNSRFVVFQANSDNSDFYNLYVSWLDGSTWQKINPDLGPGETVDDFRITPNSAGVVYRSNWEGSDFRLYASYLDGSGRRRLTNVDPTWYEITPNSMYMLYIAPDGSGNKNLYSVLITGSTPFRWNEPFGHGSGDVQEFKILADSRSALYTADTDVDGQYQLYYAWYGSKIHLPVVRR